MSAYVWTAFPASDTSNFEGVARAALEVWRTNAAAIEARINAFDAGTGFTDNTINGTKLVAGSVGAAKMDIGGTQADAMTIRWDTATGKFIWVPADASGDTFMVKNNAEDLSPGFLDTQYPLCAEAFKVKSNAGDASPGFLDAKIAAGVSITSPTGGVGYGTGAGGSVTQATSKSTAVTLNKPCGQIYVINSALAAGAQVSFTLNNSLIAPGDRVLVNIIDAVGAAKNYSVDAYPYESGGYCIIRLINETTGSLSQAMYIGFCIIKGVVA